MHCEIIDHYFNACFVEIQLKKQNLKSVIWVPEFGPPNQYTHLPNTNDTSLNTVTVAWETGNLQDTKRCFFDCSDSACAQNANFFSVAAFMYSCSY